MKLYPGTRHWRHTSVQSWENRYFEPHFLTLKGNLPWKIVRSISKDTVDRNLKLEFLQIRKMTIQDLRLKDVLWNVILLLHQNATIRNSLIYIRTLKENIIFRRIYAYYKRRRRHEFEIRIHSNKKNDESKPHNKKCFMKRLICNFVNMQQSDAFLYIFEHWKKI